MGIVGLDLSLTSTGVAVRDETFVLKPKLFGVERLDWFRWQLTDVLMVVPDPEVLIEGYSFGSKKSQAHAIGELGGVVRLLLFDLGIPFVEVPPTCRAKFATGKGNASKSAVVSAVSARTGRVWEVDDEVDAFILQEMGLTHLGSPRYAWPAENRKALDKINWSPIEKQNSTDQPG